MCPEVLEKTTRGYLWGLGMLDVFSIYIKGTLSCDESIPRNALLADAVEGGTVMSSCYNWFYNFYLL